MAVKMFNVNISLYGNDAEPDSEFGSLSDAIAYVERRTAELSIKHESDKGSGAILAGSVFFGDNDEFLAYYGNPPQWRIAK